MGKRSGCKFVLESSSAQFFECPRLDTIGSVSIEHLIKQGVYSRKNKKCQKCGVCEAVSSVSAPAQNVVPMRIKKEVRPPKHNRLHRKTIIKTVAAGVGR